MVVTNLVGVHFGGDEVDSGHGFFGASMGVSATIGAIVVAGRAWALWVGNVR